jgi:hypothetical protein
MYGEEFEKCILTMKRQAKEEKSKQTGVVGENSRISN